MTIDYDFESVAIGLTHHRELAPLASLSVGPTDRVAVIGAYKGASVAALDTLYGCEIHAFEPQVWAFDAMARRFAHRSNVRLHSCGLGTRDDTALPMYEFGNDACSFLPLVGSRSGGVGEMREARFEFARLNLSDAALILMNIEGYEFELLPYLIDYGLLGSVDNIIVQTHDDSKVPALRRRLDETHHLRWYVRNWEWWEL